MHTHKRVRIMVIALTLILVLSTAIAAPGLALWTTRQINAEYRDIKININGEPVNLSEGVEPFLIEGTTYLPLRAVAGALGKDVAWEQDSATVTIQDPDVRLFGVRPVEENGDFSAFLVLLKEISGVDLSAFDGRTATVANVATAVNTAAGIVHLENTLRTHGTAEAPVVAAKAANLLPTGYGGVFTATELNEAAFQVAAYLGLTRGYVGRMSDEDIFAKLDTVWNAIPAAMILDDGLRAIGGRLLDEGVATGFSIRNKAYSVSFIPERTLLYSHSNLMHVKQLIALLKAQGIDGRVALEPKTSWYWWEGLQYGPEFDLLLEFTSAADKAKFDAIILANAQRADGVDTSELLLGSWWTPMYASDTPLESGYAEVVNHFVYLEGSDYYLTSTGPKGSLSDAVIDIAEDMGASTKRVPQYANDKFYYEYLADLLPVEDAA